MQVVDSENGAAIWETWVIGFDHDPEPGADRTDCLSETGERSFPLCYDDHDGTDFLLEGSFDAMDAGSAAILAAADGEVVEAVDGNYDRCHGNLATGDVTCDGNERRSNHVVVEHDGGWRTAYHHMKKGSVLVEVGQAVHCGEPLGLVGSSGYSTAPHLHFMLYDPSGVPIDPYSGPASQPESYWVGQEGPYGVPEERCEGDEPPPPDTVDGPDTESAADVAGDAAPEEDAAESEPDATGAADAALPGPDGLAADSGDDAGAAIGPLHGLGGLGCATGGAASTAVPGGALAVLLLAALAGVRARRVRTRTRA